jgi:hypothetical protein
VKTDTEGHETVVLRGARHVVALAYTSWFVEVHSHEYDEVLSSTFSQYAARWMTGTKLVRMLSTRPSSACSTPPTTFLQGRNATVRLES